MRNASTRSFGRPRATRQRCGAYSAAGNLGDQSGRVIGALIDVHIVNATLVTQREDSLIRQVAARAAGVRRAERRGFQQDVHGGVGDLPESRPPMTPRQSHRALRRGDDGHARW